MAKIIHLLRKRHSTQAAGFTLVELLAGAILLAIAAVGTIGVFNSSIRQTNNSARINQQQAAIDGNLAEILRLNDRYRCGNLPASGASTTNCEILNADPNENQYAPPPPLTANFAGSGYERFRNLCRTGTLTAELIDQSNNSLARPAGIGRRAVAEAAVTGTGSTLLQNHRYRVTWTDNPADNSNTGTPSGRVLRRLILTPTVARWCPA